MTEPTHRDWREVCAEVASENDPKRMGLLLKELIRELDHKAQSKSQVGTTQTTANR